MKEIPAKDFGVYVVTDEEADLFEAKHGGDNNKHGWLPFESEELENEKEHVLVVGYGSVGRCSMSCSTKEERSYSVTINGRIYTAATEEDLKDFILRSTTESYTSSYTCPSSYETSSSSYIAPRMPNGFKSVNKL